jgi:hypothetical protein
VYTSQTPWIQGTKYARLAEVDAGVKLPCPLFEKIKFLPDMKFIVEFLVLTVGSGHSV